ncbi:hypothetical protein GQR58_000041 [Nymphon striatum]|nr:hypothetical protein GQR58_000041 [Nymphon striatum]
MFSIIPWIGTFNWLNISMPLRASINATSCGVLTMIDPSTLRLLCKGHLNVTRSRRQINQQHIQCAPLHLHHHLLQCAHQHGATPNNRLIIIGHQTNRHHGHAMIAQRQNCFAVRTGGAPADAQHARLRRTVNIGIQQANAAALGGQMRRPDWPQLWIFQRRPCHWQLR